MTISTHDLPGKTNNDDTDLLDFTVGIIKKAEGFVPFIYDDGKGVPTLGYGVALVIFDGQDWVVRSGGELADIFDGVGQSLSEADKALLDQAVQALNGDIDPNTGQIYENPFWTIEQGDVDPILNQTGWVIEDIEAELMIENILSADSNRAVTQKIDMIGGLKNQLGKDSSGNYIWDKYASSYEGAALLSL